MHYLEGFSLWHQVSEAFDMPVHQAHPEIEIYYLFRGRRNYFIENRTYPLEPGGLVYIGGSRIHKTTSGSDEPHERILFEIGSQFFSRWKERFPRLALEPLKRCPALVCQMQGQERLEMEQSLRTMVRLCETHPAGYAEEVSSRLLLIVLTLVRLAQANRAVDGVSDPKHQKVYDIVEYLSQNMNSVSSLDMLAGQFYLNKYYMCHIFKDVTGMSVNAFLNATRIRRACQLLGDTSRSVAWIAQEVGYDNATRFCRVFKKETGMTPREYRKQGNSEPLEHNST